MLSGLVFNLQKYSVHDGPGIRTTVFMKGCPLHCAWCHNPESISRKPQILLLENRCLGCRECVRACPHADCAPATGPLPTQNVLCDLCGSCIDACVTTARQMAGREMTVREVMKTVLQDRIFYSESGGGVTFSGGEPLAQPEFLQALLEACRHEGLHTAVDTCGLVRREHLLAVASLTDVFLYDLKLMDDAKHREYTGSSNVPIMENLQALGPVAQNIWIRVPIIPGVNADEANLEATARFAATIPNVRQVNLLPYHRMGTAKTQRPGSTASFADTEPPTPELMRRAVELISAHGLTAKIGG